MWNCNGLNNTICTPKCLDLVYDNTTDYEEMCYDGNIDIGDGCDKFC